MPVILPGPGYNPHPSPQTVDVTQEIIMQRELTHWYIMQDPSDISLIPKVEVKLPSGGVQLIDETPRAVQTFKLIPMSHTERPDHGFSATFAGVQRKYDFTLLGEWDAIIGKNDYWTDVDGQKWVVDSLLPYNGYQQKAMIMSYGEQAKRQ
jgi:hypothetical protein